MEDVENQSVALETALEQINAMPLPAAVEGDVAWLSGHRFVFTASGWISQPE